MFINRLIFGWGCNKIIQLLYILVLYLHMDCNSIFLKNITISTCLNFLPNDKQIGNTHCSKVLTETYKIYPYMTFRIYIQWTRRSQVYFLSPIGSIFAFSFLHPLWTASWMTYMWPLLGSVKSCMVWFSLVSMAYFFIVGLLGHKLESQQLEFIVYIF